MKANLYTTVKTALVLLAIFSSTLFANTGIESVFANQNFQITRQQNEIKIDMTKNPWESFSLAVDSYEIQRNPVVNIDVQTADAISLRVDLTDGVFMSSEAGIVKKEIPGKKSFTTIYFDFTNLIDNINLTGDVYLIFYVNPGENYKGQISLRNFNLSNEAHNNLQENQSTGFKMFPSPATTYTNIEIPSGDYTTLTLTDLNGRSLQNEDITFYNGTTFTLSLNDFPSGFYSVKISGTSNSITEKLIIK